MSFQLFKKKEAIDFSKPPQFPENFSEYLNITEHFYFYSMLKLTQCYPVKINGKTGVVAIFEPDGTPYDFTFMDSLDYNKYDMNLRGTLEFLIQKLPVEKQWDIFQNHLYPTAVNKSIAGSFSNYLYGQSSNSLVKMILKHLPMDNVSLYSKTPYDLTLSIDIGKMKQVRMKTVSFFNKVELFDSDGQEFNIYKELLEDIEHSLQTKYPNLSFHQIDGGIRKLLMKIFAIPIVKQYYESQAYSLACLFDEKNKLTEDYTHYLYPKPVKRKRPF